MNCLDNLISDSLEQNLKLNISFYCIHKENHQNKFVEKRFLNNRIFIRYKKELWLKTKHTFYLKADDIGKRNRINKFLAEIEERNYLIKINEPWVQDLILSFAVSRNHSFIISKNNKKKKKVVFKFASSQIVYFPYFLCFIITCLFSKIIYYSLMYIHT